MADMLLRAQFDDEDDMVSEDEEVNVDFFELSYVTTREGSTSALNEFDEDEYDGEHALIKEEIKVYLLGNRSLRMGRDQNRMIEGPVVTSPSGRKEHLGEYVLEREPLGLYV